MILYFLLYKCKSEFNVLLGYEIFDIFIYLFITYIKEEKKLITESI